MKKTLRSVLSVGALVIATAALVACGGGTSSAPADQRMQLELTSPTTRGSVTDSETTVTGVVSEASATITINNTPVDVGSDGSFTQTVPLAYGSNRIAILAKADGFRDASRTLTITRTLTLTVTTPADGSSVEQNRLVVAGTVSDPTATVRLLGYLVPVAADGSFSYNLALHYPTTIIPITAAVDDGDLASQSITLHYPGAAR